MVFVIVIPCLAHDLHNAQKWSHFRYLSGKMLSKDVYVAVASLRSMYFRDCDASRSKEGGTLTRVLSLMRPSRAQYA